MDNLNCHAVAKMFFLKFFPGSNNNKTSFSPKRRERQLKKCSEGEVEINSSNSLDLSTASSASSSASSVHKRSTPKVMHTAFHPVIRKVLKIIIFGIPPMGLMGRYCSYLLPGCQLGCSVAPVSAQRPLEHVKNAVQNITTEWMTHSV